jgi:hypothetical protein
LDVGVVTLWETRGINELHYGQKTFSNLRPRKVEDMADLEGGGWLVESEDNG